MLNAISVKKASGGKLVDLPQMITFPLMVETRSSFVTHVLDAVGEKYALVFPAPKAGTINKIGFVVNTVTASGDFDVRLETVDATTGHPSGTLATTNSNLSLNISTTGYKEVTLTAGHVTTKNALLAVVVSSTNTGNIAIRSIDSFRPQGFPYADFYTGTWSKQNRVTTFSVGYSDGSYPHMPKVLPAITANALDINTTTTPDEVGNLFDAPYTMRATGAWIAQLRQDVDIVLYDSSNNAIATGNLDKDTNTSNAEAFVYVYFTSSVVLKKGRTYRLVVKPTTASNASIQVYSFAAVANKETGGFKGISRTQRTDAGSWTDVTTEAIHMGLLIDQITG